VLFDIDGTLLQRRGGPNFTQERFGIPIKKIFGVNAVIDLAKYDGMGDRRISHEVVREQGITRDEFLEKFPELSRELYRYLKMRLDRENLYDAIPEARDLVQELVSGRPDVALGILSGNVEQCGWLKLEKADLRHFFRFGAFSDEFDDRIDIARSAIARARVFFHTPFAGPDVTVIGDTVHDIRSGKAIGARTIAVMSGLFTRAEEFLAESPDLLVSTLSDPRVRTILHRTES
jgi:phosphoglycolate phosphatase-like HAD superfamily hydrolase